jgi:hypothetical protein
MANAATVTYATLLDVQQRLVYGAGGYQTTDANGNIIYYPLQIVTDVKTEGSDGTVRDIQLTTPAGSSQATPYTPQQTYTVVNSAGAGPILAVQLKNAYNQATATVVS